VTHNAVVDPEATAEKSGSRGQARGVTDVAGLEPGSLSGQQVDRWRSRAVIPVRAEVIGAKCIDIEEHDPHVLAPAFDVGVGVL
jgi:hypothetical protein